MLGGIAGEGNGDATRLGAGKDPCRGRRPMLPDDGDRRTPGHATQRKDTDSGLRELAQPTVGRRAILPRERRPIGGMLGDEREQAGRGGLN